MNKILLLIISCALLGCGQSEEPQPADFTDSADSAPHIVLLVADDLGWADVQYHGSPIRTPHLNKLAQQGIELDRFYVQPMCTPTRLALLTGMDPMSSGMIYGPLKPWSSRGAPRDQPLISERLKRLGYKTVMIGKWHLGHAKAEQWPQARGFDHFYGCLTGAVDYYTHERNGGLDWQRNGVSVQEDGYVTELLTSETLRILDQHDATEPLFLYLPFTAPHSPLQAPQDQIQEYADLPPKRQIYAAMVTALDSSLGRIRAKLEEKGMASNTIFWFMSDNGATRQEGGRNLPLKGAKSTPWEGGIRVPATVYWPGRLEGGHRSSQVVTAQDLYPTLLAAAGHSSIAKLQVNGINLLSALEQKQRIHRGSVFFAGEQPKATREAVLNSPWKLVRERLKETQEENVYLFDVFQDPEEKENLAASEPDRVRELLKDLEAWTAAHPQIENAYQREMPVSWKPPRDWARAAE